MSTTFARGSVPAILPAGSRRLATGLRRCLAVLDAALVVARERRELAALDERMLRDIGLSRSMAHREASRDFLDVPEHRIGHL